jgi:cell division protein FtsL
MNNISQFFQKYRQAPWRVQTQWLALFVSGVVALALVAFGYINITNRATQAGREIQSLGDDILSAQKENADLATRLALLTSSQVMMERARDLGFREVDAASIVYVVAPGYSVPSAIDLSSPAGQPAVPASRPEYTQSLFEWFAERIQTTASATGGLP